MGMGTKWSLIPVSAQTGVFKSGREEQRHMQSSGRASTQYHTPTLCLLSGTTTGVCYSQNKIALPLPTLHILCKEMGQWFTFLG